MDSDSVHALITRLRSFRTRSAAADELVAAGEDAVEPLLQALDSEEDAARWTMINCLGQIGDRRAVPALAAYLEDNEYQTVAHDALVGIARRDLGFIERDWLAWHRSEDADAVLDEAAPQEELPDDELLDRALAGLSADVDRQSGGHSVVRLEVAGGRRQQVSVVFGGRDHEGSEIVVIYSLCGEAHPDRYEVALRENVRMPYGAVGLREVDGLPYFVMFNTILRRALSPLELRKSVTAIAERSVRVNERL